MSDEVKLTKEQKEKFVISAMEDELAEWLTSNAIPHYIYKIEIPFDLEEEDKDILIESVRNLIHKYPDAHVDVIFYIPSEGGSIASKFKIEENKGYL